jgi:hypothetical protein
MPEHHDEKSQREQGGDLRRRAQAFINLLPKLEVMVFCGLSAQRAIDLIRLPSRVQVLRTYHPGQLAYRQPKCRAVIHATFKQARRLISS